MQLKILQPRMGGRWIQPDDIEHLDSTSINGLNLYSYASNNPIESLKPIIGVYQANSKELRANNFASIFTVFNPSISAGSTNYWNPHWKNKWLDTNRPGLFVLSDEGFEVVNWSLSIYKGSLYFDNKENYSIYVSMGNIGIYAGFNYKKGIGLDASINVFEKGYDGGILDANLEFLPFGLTYMYKDGELKLKHGYGWWGWSISIDFIELFKWLFGGE